MADAAHSPAPDAAPDAAQPEGATGVLVLADGTVIWGRGFGAAGHAVGEICFNTAMTGYQEILTDPSYAAQIVTFTFPHIGNVGANADDMESQVAGAVGCIVREDVTAASSFRSTQEFGEWLAGQGKIGLSGVDTRALTRRIRMSGAPNAVIAHSLRRGSSISTLCAHKPPLGKGWRAWTSPAPSAVQKRKAGRATYGNCLDPHPFWGEGGARADGSAMLLSDA